MTIFPDYTIVIQFAFFLICYWSLKTFFFPPILYVITKREKMIELANQELRRRDAEEKQMGEEYRKKIRDARAKAQEIHNLSRKESLEEEKHILEQARKKADQERHQIEEQIQVLQQKLLQDFEQQSQKLSVQLINKSFKS